jgi:hypothetical protein
MTSLPKYGNHINHNYANHGNGSNYDSVYNHKNDSNDSKHCIEFSSFKKCNISMFHTHWKRMFRRITCTVLLRLEGVQCGRNFVLHKSLLQGLRNLRSTFITRPNCSPYLDKPEWFNWYRNIPNVRRGFFKCCFLGKRGCLNALKNKYEDDYEEF